jgi:PAS domain-containing protein
MSFGAAHMIPSDALANVILAKVVDLVKKNNGAQLRALDAFPVAIYATGIDGYITYFNQACIDFAGRQR